MVESIHINQRVRENAENLTAALESHMMTVFAPDARKELRLFSAGEAAGLLGISPSFLRKLHFDNRIQDVHTTPGGRRHYSAEDLLAIRKELESTAKSTGTYVKGRQPGDKVQVLSFLNFDDRLGVYGAERVLREKLGIEITDGRLIRPIVDALLARNELK